MSCDGLVLLAGFTARSQAYAQAMSRAGISPAHVVIFGPQTSRLPGQLPETPPQAEANQTLLLPDLSEPLLRTCERADWSTTVLDAERIEQPEIAETLIRLAPHLIVYSGYGSQIVPSSVLDLGAPLLHLHAGWLPDYRGSTTSYYSWIAEQRLGVSAIYLRPEIDTGPLVRRKHYPLPPPGVDTDYLYEPAIRADLLVEILREYASTGETPAATPQEPRGTTYYVIHPVLKHIALLST